MKPKFIIQDWAGNVCFFGRTFASFDDETLQTLSKYFKGVRK